MIPVCNFILHVCKLLCRSLFFDDVIITWYVFYMCLSSDIMWFTFSCHVHVCATSYYVLHFVVFATSYHVPRFVPFVCLLYVLVAFTCGTDVFPFVSVMYVTWCMCVSTCHSDCLGNRMFLFITLTCVYSDLCFNLPLCNMCVCVSWYYVLPSIFSVAGCFTFMCVYVPDTWTVLAITCT